MVDWPDRLDIPADFWDDLDSGEKIAAIWRWDPALFGRRFEDQDWPLTDDAGNEFPLDWIPVDEIDDDGMLTDDRGRQFYPLAGNIEPVEGKCNEPLNGWSDRYPERRWCAADPPPDGNVCYTHENREKMVTAREALQTGLQSKTRDHYYNKLEPDEQVFVHGLHEDLLGKSRYEFAPEHQTREFDFSESEITPDIDGQEGPVYEIDVVFATERLDESLALFAAATDTMKRLSVNAIVAATNMQSKTVSNAQLTAPPSENDPSPQEFKTIEEWTEHHLNLPYSRLVRDRKDLLRYGGVSIEEESQAPTQNPLLDRLQQIDAELDGDLTDVEPELVQQGSEMKQQIESAGGELDIETADDSE